MGKPSFVVGIGASAGGLEAIREFFDHTPPQTGLAFVVIQHLSPDFKSLMAGLVAQNTQMKILEAEQGMTVVANHVYLIPPGQNLTIESGQLVLAAQDRDLAPNLPIDLFFPLSQETALTKL